LRRTHARHCARRSRRPSCTRSCVTPRSRVMSSQIVRPGVSCDLATLAALAVLDVQRADYA
jgi:hypothetical protein